MNKKISKPIFVFCLSLILLLFNFSFVNANMIFNYNSVEYNLPDIPTYDTEKYSDYVIFYDSSDSSYILILQPKTGHTFFDSNKNSLTFLTNNGGISVIGYRYYVGNELKWKDYSFNQNELGSYFSNFNIDNTGSRMLIYSSCYIYIDENGSDIFFRPPVQEITLAQELAGVQVTKQWKTLMKNVVVSLVVFLIGLIAFLKAWAWLKMQLHKA